MKKTVEWNRLKTPSALNIRCFELEFHPNRIDWVMGVDVGYRFQPVNGVAAFIAGRPQLRFNGIKDLYYTGNGFMPTQASVGVGFAVFFGLSFGVGQSSISSYPSS